MNRSQHLHISTENQTGPRREEEQREQGTPVIREHFTKFETQKMGTLDADTHGRIKYDKGEWI